MSKVKFTTTIDQDILEKAKIQAIKEKTNRLSLCVRHQRNRSKS